MPKRGKRSKDSDWWVVPLVVDITARTLVDDRGFVVPHPECVKGHHTLVALDAIHKHWPRLAKEIEELAEAAGA